MGWPLPGGTSVRDGLAEVVLELNETWAGGDLGRQEWAWVSTPGLGAGEGSGTGLGQGSSRGPRGRCGPGLGVHGPVGTGMGPRGPWAGVQA